MYPSVSDGVYEPTPSPSPCFSLTHTLRCIDPHHVTNPMTIQNHAPAMGVEVSSVMDRCVTGSSDSLLLQETRLLVMCNHAQTKSFEHTLLDVQKNIPIVLKKALQDQEQILERFSAASVVKLERIQVCPLLTCSSSFLYVSFLMCKCLCYGICSHLHGTVLLGTFSNLKNGRRRMW